MRYEEPDLKNRRGFVATNRACHGGVLAILQIVLEEQSAS